MILQTFATSTCITKTSKLSPTTVVLYCAGWIRRQRRLRLIGVLGKKFFARKWPESFLKVGIFSELDVSLEKVFTFMRGLWCRICLRLGPGQLSSVSPNPPQLIQEGFLGVLLLIFFFYFPHLEIFLPTPLNITCHIREPNLSLYLPYYAGACNEFAVPISAS